MTTPLHGLKVVEFGGLAPGPLIGMVLADFGADVVRIDKVGASLNPDSLARGKRSLAISPKHPKGLHALRTLISQADVLIDPFRPGVLERLGLGPEDVQQGREGVKGNPGLVFARITGYQRTGPYGPMAGHDINYIAISGLLSMLGAQGGPPQPPINLLGDFAGGSLVCVIGILMALLERQRSGQGQVVEADMVTGARYISTFLLLGSKLRHPSMGAPVNDGTDATRGRNMLDGGAPFYGVYRTQDDKWISVGAIEPQFYRELLQILEKNLSTSLRSRLPSPKKQHDQSQWPTDRQFFIDAFREKTRAEWTQLFISTDACVAPILTPDEAALEAVEPRWPSAEQERMADLPVVPTPAPVLSRTPARVPSGSVQSIQQDADADPQLLLTPGEHTDQVLQDWIGLSASDIADLYRGRAIGGPDAPDDIDIPSKL